MKKVFVLTWDNEYEGLLESYKAYSSEGAARQAVENYINRFNPEVQALMRNGDLSIPQIHELVLCD